MSVTPGRRCPLWKLALPRELFDAFYEIPGVGFELVGFVVVMVDRVIGLLPSDVKTVEVTVFCGCEDHAIDVRTIL